MKNMKRGLPLAAAFLLCAALFAGCSRSAGNAASAGNAGRTDLIIALTSDVATLHPANYSTTSELHVLRQVFDTCNFAIVDGSNTQPQPRIAESYTVSADGLTYTYRLRRDVKFHNGDALTSKDVKFSIELFQQSPYQDSWVEGIESVQTPDDYTVVVKLENLYAPYLLNFTQVMIVPMDYFNSIGAEAFANAPVGCGPYKFVSRAIGNNIVLEAFDGYYRGAAAIKNVEFKVMVSGSTRAIALQTEDIDLAEIAASDYSVLSSEPNIVIQQIPTTSYCFVTMNQERSPFNNLKFRQAVSYAINRQDMINVALDGFGTENSIIISPLVFGYSADVPTYNYNPERAKALLAEAGIATPLNLGPIPTSERYIKQATILQSNLADIGLNTTIETLEFNTLISQTMGGQFGIAIMGLTFEPDPTQHSLLFSPVYIGGPNMSRYRDNEVTEWFNEAVKTPNDTERAAIYKKIFQRVQEDAAYASIYNPTYLVAYNKALNIIVSLNDTYYVYDAAWR